MFVYKWETYKGKEMNEPYELEILGMQCSTEETSNWGMSAMWFHFL